MFAYNKRAYQSVISKVGKEGYICGCLLCDLGHDVILM